jgi:predicted permease
LLTESVILAVCGGVLGLLIGVWGVRALIRLIPGELPRAAEFTTLDPRILFFTLAVCVLTAILFGLFPALQISRPDLASTLKESSSRSGTSLRHNRSRALLVVTETALAMVLLIGAALLIRSFASLRNTNPGFDTSNLLTMKISLAGAKYAKTAAVERLLTETVQRVESLPGVVSASPTIAIPMEGALDLPFTIEGRPTSGGPYHGDEQWRTIGAHYFTALNAPVRRGRAFDERDSSQSTPVLVINEAFARRYWPKENPIGQRVTIGKGLGPQFEEATRQIVGVAPDIRERRLNAPPPPVMYIPIAQTTDGLMTLANAVIPMCFVVRTGPRPHSFAPAIERELQAVDGQLALTKVRSMEDVLADVTARQNFSMLLLGIFSAIALLLAAIGIYGLMSYSVEQRTQEIGIRMALGAGQGRMVGMIVRQGAQLAVAGVAIGLAASYGLTRLMTTLLYDVKANDPVTFAAIAVLLTAVALAATYIPARRTTKVDPVSALRYE